jgi:hypothetical protein
MTVQSTTAMPPKGMPPMPAQTASGQKPNYQLSAEDAKRVGHEQDYSWITGRLGRDGGRWVIRYAAPDEVERFGGSLPLAFKSNLAQMADGDLVCLHGQVINVGRSQMSPAGTVYQVNELNVIERAHQ